jgi:hypothetical protein
LDAVKSHRRADRATIDADGVSRALDALRDSEHEEGQTNAFDQIDRAEAGERGFRHTLNAAPARRTAAPFEHGAAARADAIGARTIVFGARKLLEHAK